jgi:hypothetical protein
MRWCLPCVHRRLFLRKTSRASCSLPTVHCGADSDQPSVPPTRVLAQRWHARKLVQTKAALMLYHSSSL